MFRVVIHEDGSTDVLEPKSGRHLCSIPDDNVSKSVPTVKNDYTSNPDYQNQIRSRSRSPGSEYSQSCSSHFDEDDDSSASDESLVSAPRYLKSYLLTRKPPNRIPSLASQNESQLAHLPPDEPESDCMDSCSFFRYLNLIHKDAKFDEDKKRKWPLREISQSESADKTSYIRMYVRKPIKTSIAVKEPSREHLLMMNGIQSILDKVQKQLETELRNPINVQNFIKNCLGKVPISSKLGARLRKELPILNNYEALNLISKNEDYCQTENILSRPVNTARNSRLNSPLIYSRSRTHRHAHHYCFNKKERLERYTMIRTGLNLKSRIKSWLCEPLNVNLNKLQVCPLCNHELGKQHNCIESKENGQLHISSPEDFLTDDESDTEGPIELNTSEHV